MKTTPKLHIMPIKKMIDWVKAYDSKSVAVLVAASYELDFTKMPNQCIAEMFDDIDYECPGRSITNKQAEEYANFIRTLPDSTETIICACNAGESRSTALCAALCEYYSVDSSWIWESYLYHPNMLVFDLFTKALGVEVDDFRKDELFQKNRNAFSIAIKNARGDQNADSP